MPQEALAGGAQELVLFGPLLVGMLVAATAGLVSFFSPCTLPLVPGYLSYVAGLAGNDAAAPDDRADQRNPSAGSAQLTSLGTAPPRRGVRSRTVLGSVLFVLGFTAVFTSYGALFGTFGGLLVRHQTLLLQGSGVLMVVLGLLFAGALPKVPLAGRSYRPSYRPRVGLGGAPLLGATFGLGWTPCMGPTLAAVLTLAASTAGAGRGAAMAAAYSLGLGLPFILTALSAQRSLRTSDWMRAHARGVARTGGAFLVLIGLLQLTGLWGDLLIVVQGWAANWQVPL